MNPNLNNHAITNKLVIAFLSLLILFSGCNSQPPSKETNPLSNLKDSFVSVTPLMNWDGFGFTEAPELLRDSLFLNTWVLVFSYYAVPVFRIEERNGVVVKIPPMAASDKEFIYNMTSKAQDSTWVEYHLGKRCY